MRAIRVAIAGMILAGSGTAVQADKAQSAAAANGSELQEIIVTAEKREESASKTPVALTVMSGSALQTAGVVNISELQDVAPAVNVGRDSFGININIRGVTTTDNTSKGDEGIAFNVDGIPIGRPREMSVAFFDLNRVEVLRGPQGTLYGKSSTGGAINLISNKPVDELEASAAFEVGNYNTRRADVVLNVPVTNTLAVRFAGNSNVREGFLEPSIGNKPTLTGEPPLDDQNDITGRLSILWNFADWGSLLFTDTSGHIGGVGSGNGNLGTVDANSGSAQRQVLYDPFGGKIDDRFDNFNWEFNAELGAVHVVYDGARLNFDADELTSSNNDPIGNYQGPPPAVPVYAWGHYVANFVTDSHELRFSNSQPQTLEWVAGINWYREQILNESDHRWSAPIANPTVAGSHNGIDPEVNTVHRTYAAFGQINYHLTEAWKLTLGLREASDKVARTGTFAAGPGPWLTAAGTPCVPPDACVGPPDNGLQSATKLTYRVGTDYHITPQQMIYASVATGYKSGGFNDFDPITGKPTPYEPEQLTAYEVGYKGLLAGSLQFNSGAYYYDYSKTQISSLVNVSGSTVLYTRAVPTELYGWENEVQWRVTRADEVDASLAVERSKYKNFQAGIFENVNWSGYSLDKTPHLVGTLGYAHTWTLPDGATLRAHAFSKYSSSYLLSDFVNAVQFTQDSFTRSSADLTYMTPNERLYVQGYVHNIENKLQLIGAPGGYTPGAPNAANSPVSEPRFFGVRVGVKY